jgi:hypothetical protein
VGHQDPEVLRLVYRIIAEDYSVPGRH